MFFYAKCQFVAIVIIIFARAMTGSSSGLPYFPIEISRAAAANASIAGSPFFFVAMLTLLPTLTLETYWLHWAHMHSPLDTPLLLVPAVLLAAWFDDRAHIWLHNLGVLLLLLLVVAHALLLQSEWRHPYIVVGAAFALFASSAALKGAAALYLELDQHPLEWRMAWWLLSNRGDITTRTARKVVDVMFAGESTCLLPQLTIPIYRVTGVMQWCGFYLLSVLY